MIEWITLIKMTLFSFLVFWSALTHIHIHQAIRIHFCLLGWFRVAVGLEPVPAVTQVGCTL